MEAKATITVLFIGSVKNVRTELNKFLDECEKNKEACFDFDTLINTSAVTFHIDVSSSDERHCEWQVDEFIKAARKIPEIKSVSADVWVHGNTISFERK